MNTIINSNVKFVFHNIGQGLFYTGKIGNFNFVYDCGSENKFTNLLKKKIDDYINKTLSPRKTLDLLILSHFHDDHISGVDYLLKKINVKTIIIPYFTPIERIILSLRNINLGDSFYNFLVDPVDFLLKRKVNQVVILGSKKEPEPYFNEPNKNYLDNNEEVKINLEDLENDKDLYDTFLKNEIDWAKDPRIKNVFMKTHKKSMFVFGNWIFRFFNYKVTERNMKIFIDELNKNKISLDGSRQSLRNIITDKKIRKKLRITYKKLHKDLNNTSIVLFHGPVNFKNLNYRYNIKCCNYVYYRNFCNLCFIKYPNIGQFLTGDINLNNCYNDIIQHYKKYLKDIILSSVPHHGAQSNWNLNIISDLSNCYNYIASASISNIYGHPRFGVFSDIKNSSKYFCWNNEKNKIKITGLVNW